MRSYVCLSTCFISQIADEIYMKFGIWESVLIVYKYYNKTVTGSHIYSKNSKLKRIVLYQQVSRYGSAATLELDGGEGRRYNETFQFEGHQWLLVDKQEGVYAGGKAEYTGVRTFEVYADYQKGNFC